MREIGTASAESERAPEEALWARIAAHPFEDARALDFTGRLAADMGWSRAQAKGAVEEYRRFCFLAVTGTEPATPSEEVDAVWHLHLTYSRDYWSVWCPQVLERPLHHDPTGGGPAEDARYHGQYARTLARYETAFGPPDPAFWPGTAARFGPRPRYRMVDTHRVWLLPRPSALRRVAPAACLLLCLPTGALALPSTPLDWRGPEFLGLYLPLALLAVAASFALAVRLRFAPGRAALAGAPTLDPLEAALLAGGPGRVADLVALILVTSGSASVERFRGRLVVEGLQGEAARLRPFLGSVTGPTRRRDLMGAVGEALGPLRRRLHARGLLLDPEETRGARWVALAPIAAVALFGIAKLVVGIERHRTVGFLLVTLLGLAASAGLLWWWLSRPTRAGAQALDALSRNQARALRAPMPSELPLAFAIGGIGILSASAYPELFAYLKAPLRDSGSGCGTGGSGCGSGSGGGGGCGGCGGGGGD